MGEESERLRFSKKTDNFLRIIKEKCPRNKIFSTKGRARKEEEHRQQQKTHTGRPLCVVASFALQCNSNAFNPPPPHTHQDLNHSKTFLLEQTDLHPSAAHDVRILPAIYLSYRFYRLNCKTHTHLCPTRLDPNDRCRLIELILSCFRRLPFLFRCRFPQHLRCHFATTGANPCTHSTADDRSAPVVSGLGPRL